LRETDGGNTETAPAGLPHPRICERPFPVLSALSNPGRSDFRPDRKKPLTTHRSIDPRAPPVRDIPAQSPSVAMADQVRSHGTGSYQVDAHDPVAGGRASTGDRYSTAMAVITAVVMLTATRNTYLGAGHEARAGCL